ncbi:MAG TPA: hypothetical protein VD997_08490 [Phycisphaerales bacterium]|nr:hypothetical protein [Phycisphaerales bacterium]
MAGRRQTPLFDLLSRSQASAPPPATPRPAKPVVRVELKPREPSYAPDPEPAPEQVVHVNGRAYPAWIKSVVAVVAFLALVAAWSAGSWFGEKRAEKELSADLRRDPPKVQEPDESVPMGTTSTAAASTPATTNPRPSSGVTALPPATGRDPREPGKNYLYLANLPREDAESTVGWLRQNGLNAHYVPVESAAGGANNAGPGLYRVFVGDGLTSDEYRQSVRTKMEAEVVKLGAIWQKQHRGSSNFEKFLWEKFK